MKLTAICALTITALCLAACDEDAPPLPDIRPVRFVKVDRQLLENVVSLTGQIRAQEEVSLAFRLGGRVIERLVDVGDKVAPGQLVARLDAEMQRNAVTSASADLDAASAQLTQVTAAFERQKSLLASGFTTRALFDQAQQQLQTAQSQVDGALAQLSTAQDQLGYTELRADAPGIVTATGLEAGEVVAAGQMVVQIAQKEGRDAVFDVPAVLLRSTSRDSIVTLALTDDPNITAKGRLREVAPQANPTTRTFQVKVGLVAPPEAMRLGATVTGSVTLNSGPVMAVPATALTKSEGKPAVWTVQEAAMTVELRPIDVLRYEPESVVVASGLEPGDIVVTAGVQALRPGQTVRLLGGAL